MKGEAASGADNSPGSSCAAVGVFPRAPALLLRADAHVNPLPMLHLRPRFPQVAIRSARARRCSQTGAAPSRRALSLPPNGGDAP